MFDSLFPKEWTTLQRLMWLKTNALARAVYETITGNPVSFTAKAAPLRQLKVAFSPVQDLHGYDAPWPAGGGKNLLDASTVFGGESSIYTVNSDGSVTVLSSDGRAWRSCPALNLPAGSYIISKTPTTGTSDIRLSSEEYGTPHIFTSQFAFTLSEAGSVKIKVAYSAQTYPSTQKVQIESGSTPTAWTPYSNECPISGWDSLTVEQRGKNLLNPDISAYSENVNYRYLNGVVPDGQVARMTITDKDTSVNASGCYIGFTDTDLSEYGTVSHSKWVIENGVVKTNATNTTGIGGTIIMSNVFIYPKTQETFDKLFARFNIQVELGSTASEYQPYTGRSISITLGSTVYSGYVDLVTGQGEVTMAEVDMGSIGWNYSVNDKRFYNNTQPIKPHTNASAVPALLSSLFKAVNLVDFVTYLTKDGTMAQNGAYIFVRDLAYTDAPSFKAAVTGQTLCYELATPLTIQLTPQEVESLAGDNTMWSNANQPITVEYRKN